MITADAQIDRLVYELYRLTEPTRTIGRCWGAKQLIDLWSAISNRKVTIEDSVAEGDRVATRFTISGTHTGSFMGIAPTGKTIHVSASGIFRIVDGKATDNWVNFDALGMLQQLGAVPMPQW
jgi:predicted ester cyclase